MNLSGSWSRVGFVLAFVAVASAAASAERGLTFTQLAAIREVGEIRVSPDGSRIAYTLEIPRTIGVDDDGPEWVELWLTGIGGGDPRPFVHGDVKVETVRFSPDGSLITYLAKRADDEHGALYAIPVDGGESRRLVDFDETIRDYRLSPDGRRVAFVAREPESEAAKQAKEHGYKQEVFEEDWRQQKLWIAELAPFTPTVGDPDAPNQDDDRKPRALPIDGAVFGVDWTPDGKQLLLEVAPTPLIDDRFMRRRIGVYDVDSGERSASIANVGKLGAVELSPDGRNVAMIAAADANDPLEGRLAVAPIGGGEPRDLLPGLLGHVTALAWRDPATVAYLADVGEETIYGEVGLTGGEGRELLRSGSARADGAPVPVMTRVALSADGAVTALVGESPRHPPELFVLAGEESVARRLTDSNPWLGEVELADQELYRHEARDGLSLSGVLIR
ncbi:MAG TPA: hypothetical protein VD788_07175, partial [Candidatus Polarisedimenticolaceae bacterium]|nr:hypothetical protein [Candidatus Polarisedimenticolaceae bacterium]